MRMRYWKLSSSEMDALRYDPEKVLNWEIKCIREPEDGAHFVGIFAYRHGTPYDYESIKGICYYHNNIPKEELPSITKFLQGRFGGKEIKKGERIFLKDSKVAYAGAEIGSLARDLEDKLKAKAVISLEFDGLTQEQLKDAGMPEAKLLPIPGK